MIILTGDPGLANYGLAHTSIVRGKFTVHGTGMLLDTIRGITDAQMAREEQPFLDAWETLINRVKPDVVGLERFLVRSFGTKNIEIISVMNGLVRGLCNSHGIECRYLISSQWKNGMNRCYGKNALTNMYAAVGGMDIPKGDRILPHRVDAALIGAYIGQNGKFGTVKIPRGRFMKEVGRDLTY